MQSASANPTSELNVPGAMKQLHFAPKAKRIIYLFMSGAPSQLDLYDPKPKLTEMMGKDLPDSVRNGQRITTMTSGQSKLLCVGSPFKFKKYGSAGMELSELLPNLSKVVDECTFVRSLNTDPINHDPAVTFFCDRKSTTRSSNHGCLVGVWHGVRQLGPAFICGADQWRWRTNVTDSLLGQWFFTSSVWRSSVPQCG